VVLPAPESSILTGSRRHARPARPVQTRGAHRTAAAGWRLPRPTRPPAWSAACARPHAVDLSLPAVRQVVHEAADKSVGQQARGRNALVDDLWRCGLLHQHLEALRCPQHDHQASLICMARPSLSSAHGTQNCAGRFCKNAATPSAKSAVAAHSRKVARSASRCESRERAPAARTRVLI
jgi:hypothetical protein